MTITWLGHSCFILESSGFRVILDPYHEVRGLPDVAAEADAVYCSHDHFDHAWTENIRLTTGKENPFTVKEIQTCHDNQGGAQRGKNIVRTFTAEGVTVAHLGDLGHRLSAEQLAGIGRCDAILIPVGGFYTIDAAEARSVADAIGAPVVIPMHYRKDTVGFDVLGTVEDFTVLYPQERVKEYPSNVLTLTRDTPPQVAVLTLAK
ncbi:MAG: MBL fold metallo-hydrolase [Oscillibacter sp.]|nr:MBL fold metallo-hydrolase [Oscillibacter sp.]